VSHDGSTVLAHVKHRKASVRTLVKVSFFWLVYVRLYNVTRSFLNADRLLPATDEGSRYTFLPSFESWELHESLNRLFRNGRFANFVFPYC
jgi:hypothetical protein